MNTKFPNELTDDASWAYRWQMSNAERCALQVILDRLSPGLSLEVGTYQGGSLQVISPRSKEVISLDIDPGVEARLDGAFDNVEFHSGDSATLLPKLVCELNESGRQVSFVLIDGDHSEAGVRRDIEAVLGLNVKERMVILMHDGFNPDCRSGMRSANWAACKNVHYVELDFTIGNFHEHGYDHATPRTMWGGFACAVLEPEERMGELVINERQKIVFQTMFKRSVHAPPSSSTPPSFAQKIKNRMPWKLRSFLAKVRTRFQ